MLKTDKIDFVITWVDRTDKKWIQEKMKYDKKNSGDNGIHRYRDWENLRYWFRGVEKYAPWVNKIHFVTCGHLPIWLNVNHPKINIVSHKDYIPEEYLPTFNSNVIELNFHRIPGISEQFVYFNDDVFLIRPVKPEDYFKKGLPCDMLAFQPIVVKPENTLMAYIFLNNTAVLAKHFDKRKNIKAQPFHYFKPGYPLLYLFYNMLEYIFPLFTGFYTVHGAAPFKKKSYEQLWEKENDIFTQTCSHKFRNKDDINQYLIREWQKLNGDFSPQNIQKNFRYFEVQQNNTELMQTIVKQKVKTICFNDTNPEIEVDKVKMELINAFEMILPKKSQFEI